MISPGWLRQQLFGMSLRETTVARRGFQVDTPHVRQRLEHIGAVFLHGYHAALDHNHPEGVVQSLQTIPLELQGFAFEGAAMGFALLDALTPWPSSRWHTFLVGPAAPHAYIVYVGAGWALAVLRRRVQRPLARLDPLLRWLVVDGYGFYHGYFHWPRAVTQHRVPRHLQGYARQAFDQGLGRSLWFVQGADVSRIQTTIATFPESRQADLWSGVGLACAYAGGVDQEALQHVLQAAGAYGLHLRQGVVFAAKTRQRAGNPAPHTELACAVICGMSADAAAHLTDVFLQALPPDGVEPAYEVWRQRIRTVWVKEEVSL